MSTSPLSPITVAANAVTTTSVSPPPPAPTSADGATPAQDPADYRLVIEDDKAAGSFVYKTIDRRTGEVVSQVPREEILKLREAFNYSAGDVISAKA